MRTLHCQRSGKGAYNINSSLDRKERCRSSIYFQCHAVLRLWLTMANLLVSAAVITGVSDGHILVRMMLSGQLRVQLPMFSAS